VRRFLTISRLNAENIFKEKDLMDVYLFIALIYAAQENVNANLQEGSLDFILVNPPLQVVDVKGMASTL